MISIVDYTLTHAEFASSSLTLLDRHLRRLLTDLTKRQYVGNRLESEWRAKDQSRKVNVLLRVIIPLIVILCMKLLHI